MMTADNSAVGKPQTGDHGWPANVVSLILYTLLAIISTWPLASQLDSRLVVGTEVARTVPLFNAWTLWWNVDRLDHGLEHYWDAPIFFPATNTLALSEPQPLLMLMAPVMWFGGSVFLAANLYLIISLILNGMLGRWTLLVAGMRPAVAMGGGVAMVLLPIAHWQIGVQQLVPIWGLLWTWTAFYQVMLTIDSKQKVNWRSLVGRGVSLGLAFSISMMLCAHHGLFLALLLVITIPVLAVVLLSAPQLFKEDSSAANSLVTGLSIVRRFGGIFRSRPETTSRQQTTFTERKATLQIYRGGWMLGVSAVVVGLLCGSLVYHLRAMPADNVSRPESTIRQLSLPLGDYFAVYGRSYMKWGSDWARTGWYLSPGWAKLGLAAIGLIGGLWITPRRRWTLVIGSVGTAALVLSLGARLNIFGWEPWWFIAEYVPGFAQVRNVFRFAYFVQIGSVLLAAQAIDMGLDRLTASRQTFPRRSIYHGLAIFGLVVCGLWAALDPWPPRIGLGVVTHATAQFADQQTWIEQLAKEHEIYQQQHPAERVGALCLPMAAGDHVGDFEITTDWMLLSGDHGVPLVNGYSGFFPQVYFQLRDTIWKTGVTAGVANRLWHEGVRWIVVDLRRFPLDWGESRQIGHIDFTRVRGTNDELAPDEPAGDDAAIVVYRMTNPTAGSGAE